MTKDDKMNKISLFVPGRLCLFGEHSDWAGVNRTINPEIVPGCAIVTGIEQGIYATAYKSELFVAYSRSAEGEELSFSCEMDMHKLKHIAREGEFFSYMAGVASYMSEWYHVGGITIEITEMDLPMKSGLSSSAAICVLVVKAFNELYDLRLNTMGIMNIAYWGEQRTPSQCGRLDQACAFGVKPVSMIFDGNEIEVRELNVGRPLYYVFANLMAGKDTVKILKDLNKAYPYPEDEIGRCVQEALGEDNAAITERARNYMEEGKVEELGALMVEAQELFDEKVAPQCPEELKAPVLHSVLNDENIKALTYGAKGVGSQGDGTVQFLARDAGKQRELIEYLENQRHMRAYPFTLKPNKETGKSVKKAVIPVAGFGTRLYPETRGVKKEFCPVVDRDGLVKPGILVLLEELHAIGIEKICMILNRDEQKYYENFFFKPLKEEHLNKLPERMRSYEEKIREIAAKLTFAYQEEQRGFGHAVYQAKDFADGEPVLLLLGDTIYSSNTETPCTKQLLDAYEQFGEPIVAVQNVLLADVGNYGLFSGEWKNDTETILKLTEIKEKPTTEYAKERLAVTSRKVPENYLAAFGTYVITREVFDRLEEAIDANIVNAKGEIELTDALAYVAENYGMYACLIDGISYDLGNPQAYRNTVSNFGK